MRKDFMLTDEEKQRRQKSDTPSKSLSILESTNSSELLSNSETFDEIDRVSSSFSNVISSMCSSEHLKNSSIPYLKLRDRRHYLLAPSPKSRNTYSGPLKKNI